MHVQIVRDRSKKNPVAIQSLNKRAGREGNKESANRASCSHGVPRFARQRALEREVIFEGGGTSSDVAGDGRQATPMLAREPNYVDPPPLSLRSLARCPARLVCPSTRARPTLLLAQFASPTSSMASPDVQAPNDGPSRSGSEVAQRPSGVYDERAELLHSNVSFRSGDCDGHETALSNRFRSNIEIVEKPRQMIVLVATIVGASYLVSSGFAARDRDSREERNSRGRGCFRVFPKSESQAASCCPARACVPQFELLFKPTCHPVDMGAHCWWRCCCDVWYFLLPTHVYLAD